MTEISWIPYVKQKLEEGQVSINHELIRFSIRDTNKLIKGMTYALVMYNVHNQWLGIKPYFVKVKGGLKFYTEGHRVHLYLKGFFHKNGLNIPRYRTHIEYKVLDNGIIVVPLEKVLLDEQDKET